MRRRLTEITIVILGILIGVLTNVATGALPDMLPVDWKQYLWLAWLPLGVIILLVVALEWRASRDQPAPTTGEPAATGPRVQSTVTVQDNQGTVIETQFNQPDWRVAGNVTNVAGDQQTINTGGGDYAEGNIDKRQGTFIDQQIVQQAVALLPALHQLRAPVGDFVGRADEVDQLVQALSATNGASATISGVRGMGGIGKTELAYAVAQRLAEQFPDAQILVELRGASSAPLTPTQALQTAIRAFEREAKLPDDLGELRQIYCSVLAGKRALIFADDANDAMQVRPLLPPPGCALLVTGRQRFSLPGMAALDLGTLPPEAAEMLLLEVCPRIGAHAGELARLCGALPLALRVSASLLANSSRSIERYLAQLATERLQHLSDPDTPGDPAASVEASLRLSYDALESVAQRALCQLSVFPVSFDQSAALAVLEVAGDGEALLDLLQRRSLLEWDATVQRFSLHELVRVFAAARLADGDAVQQRYARHYARVAEAADKLYLEGGAATLTGLALFDRERAHIDAGWAWVMAHAGDQDADALVLDYADATAYAGDLRYDKRRERIPQLTAALAAAQRLNDRGAEGNALGSLGLAYAALGDARQAITFYEQWLVIAREIGDRRGEANASWNLGHALEEVGDLARAAELMHVCVDFEQEIGHPAAEKHAARLGQVRQRMAGGGSTAEKLSRWWRRLTRHA